MTLEELAALLTKSAEESAQTNQILNEEVVPRLNRVETLVGDAGLNGHTALLKKFLDEYAAGQTKQQAWTVVRADIKAKLRWLTVPKGWFKMLGAAVVGGLGWSIASHLLSGGIHIPNPF